MIGNANCDVIMAQYPGSCPEAFADNLASTPQSAVIVALLPTSSRGEFTGQLLPIHLIPDLLS